MTYDDWKLRSDRDENPELVEDRWPDEPWDEPVSCVDCERTHELQESFFCQRCKGGGYCRLCWRSHPEKCSA